MEKEQKKGKSWILQTILISVLLIVFLGLGYAMGLVKASNDYTKEMEKNKNINNEEQTNNTTDETEQIKSTMSEEEALELGNKLWDLSYKTFWGNEEVWKFHYGERNQYGGQEKICDVTKEELKKPFTTDFQGYTCLFESGNCTKMSVSEFVGEQIVGECENASQRGSNQYYITTTLKVKEITEEKIDFIATSEYCDNHFCEQSRETTATREYPFTIVKENNNWLISVFYIPN